VRASKSLARNCSGDMYATVPTAVPGLVRVLRAHPCRRIRGEGGPRGDSFALGCQLGQTEIQYFRVPSFCYEDVGWFDVAVDDAFRVGRIEPVRNLDGQIEDAFNFHRAASDAVLQRHTVQELHHDIRLTVFLTNVINRADVRVVERGGRLRFSTEPFECLMVTGQIFRKELQGDGPM
jgi:hypothetical protein